MNILKSKKMSKNVQNILKKKLDTAIKIPGWHLAFSREVIKKYVIKHDI